VTDAARLAIEFALLRSSEVSRAWAIELGTEMPRHPPRLSRVSTSWLRSEKDVNGRDNQTRSAALRSLARL